jgi:hypothetical protein
MIHRNKLRMARKMMTREEIAAHVPPFLSKGWLERKAFKAAVKVRLETMPEEIRGEEVNNV